MTKYSGLTGDEFMDGLCDKLSHLPRDKQREAEAAIRRHLETLGTHQQCRPPDHEHWGEGGECP